MLCLSLIASITCALQTPDTTVVEVQHRNWLTPIQLNAKLTEITDANEAVTITTIGHARSGHPIQCIRVARSGSIPIEDRSSVLVVAGIDGDHLLGSEVAVDLVNELLARDTEETDSLLVDHALYIIPQVNPDGAGMYFGEIQGNYRRNGRPVDNDHDGSIDEDGGDDLNNDGYITMMRVPDVENSTHLSDPDNPRLEIKPDALEGQSAAYLLYTEGIDNDGDGKYNEDGLGGVDLNKNFMHGYKYHSDGAGPWQLSEPESKALIDYVLGHQGIAAIVVYGQHDTLSTAVGEGGKDAAGAPKKLDSGDVEIYKQISERFVELTSLKKNVEQPNWDGSFVAWAYAQYGVPAFSTPLWSRPEPVEDEEEGSTDDVIETDPHPEQEQDRARGEGRGGRPDRQAMREQFDVDGDGELNDEERQEMREAMRERFGGRGQGDASRSGPPHGGPPQGGRPSASSESEYDSTLTPSGVGDISQETLDDLMEAAIASGYPVTDEMMEEITPEEVEMYAKMTGVEIRRVTSSEKSNKKVSGEAAWLAYSDDQREGAGFVEWTPFDHPQLGAVEIGGWVPYFQTLPPTNAIQEITTKQSDFIIDLAGRLPKVRLSNTIVKELGNGLWEVKVAISNDGWLPSGTAMAKRNKRARPYVVRLEVPNQSIVTGQKVNRIWSLDGGGTKKWYRWIIQGASRSTVNITLYSEKFGSESIPITLQNTTGGDS